MSTSHGILRDKLLAELAGRRDPATADELAYSVDWPSEPVRATLLRLLRQSKVARDEVKGRGPHDPRYLWMARAGWGQENVE